MRRPSTIAVLLLAWAWVTAATEFTGVDQQRLGPELLITPQFDIQLSDKVTQAIQSGIVITFVMQVQLKQSVDWWLDRQIDHKIQTMQVRYFSLSSQYQLHNRNTNTKQSFANLNGLLAHMGGATTFSFQAEPAADYLQTRLFLDKQALPSIMQLPNVFDPDWNLNTDWQVHPLNLTTDPETSP
ncbi:DUF4390 domain-containing protein [Marinicella meishanensis]|uniref:DUF4390 domain-containing protein n=1 Tax=Marinicella meishanensis TaxID=2873263 RepID=UPI001CBC3CE1|nr:DUF4390 domain-containing protein [Marinicella sp. NBU2979]